MKFTIFEILTSIQKMGCLKLTYSQNNSHLKVAYSVYAKSQNNCTGAYRYGFNGKEKDDELKGSGNSYDFGARIYDPRLGVFLSVDPDFEQYPFMSPYCYAANSPIKLIDEEGKGPRNPQRGGNFRPTLRAPNYLEMRLAIERSNFNNRPTPKPVYQPQPIRPSSAPYAVMYGLFYVLWRNKIK